MNTSSRKRSSKGRQSSLLTIRLIEEIRSAIKMFKPSKSLAKLVDDARATGQQKPETYIDVVISGGGLRGYFMAGASSILFEELERHNIKIGRVSGASAGAWAAMFMLCNYSTHDWIETYHQCRENPSKCIHDVYQECAPWVFEGLPPDAYKICTGRLFISVSVLTMFGFKNKIISKYESNEDLLNCLFASSTIPFLTEPSGLRKLHGDWVCDGGATNNCPVFTDGKNRQIVFRLFDVEYPLRLLVNAAGTEKYTIINNS